MNIREIKRVLEDFNKKINNRIELFFFQNCNKGTLEAHYTLCDVANYTLSSPAILGAPNYYYESLFEFLGQNSDIKGDHIAQRVAEFERSDMYSIYVVTKNNEFSKIIESMNRLIDSILESRKKQVNLQTLNSYMYFGERYIDIMDFFEELINIYDVEPTKYVEFVDVLKSSVTPMKNPTMTAQDNAGLSLFLPFNMDELNPYLDLPIYIDSKTIGSF